MLLGTQRINSRGELEVGGLSCVELARQFGTPLYVMDETHIRSACRQYRETFAAKYPHDVAVSYAGKAFLTLAMCRLVDQEGLHLDVCSGGELHTALKADFPMERAHLHGNNKSDAEIALAIDSKIGRIVVDSLQEIDQIERIAEGRRVPVMLRITPGIKAKTHEYMQTAQLDVKFGLGMVSGQAMAGTRRCLDSSCIELRGFHCHIGSQLFGLDCYRETTRVVFDFMAEVREATGFIAGELNLGGGLGIRYVSDDVGQAPTIGMLAAVIEEAVVAQCKRLAYPFPTLFVEPGRSIVGEGGLTLYTAGVVKEIPGIRTYVSVDGGMSDNPRPALYQAEYEIIVANRASEKRSETITIAGKHCETDVLIVDAPSQPVRPGDVIAVQSTGAYNYAMASNYNRLTRPAVVFVADGRADVVVERETYDDLVAKDRIPDRLSR
jgi:diaminopimelate decarboxylase